MPYIPLFSFAFQEAKLAFGLLLQRLKWCETGHAMLGTLVAGLIA